MFTSAFRMGGALLVAAALCVSVSIIAVYVAGRKCSIAKLIFISILLAGFVVHIALLIPEIQNYNLETSRDLAMILKKGIYLCNHRGILNYLLYLVFHLIYYSLGAFYFSYFSPKHKLKIVMIKSTAAFVPMILLVLFMRFAEICRDARIDYLYFAEIYIGCLIGYGVSKLILSKKGNKENG